jgi:endonuclease/exonuclease/phosphatase family metal-dependent hydrolase
MKLNLLSFNVRINVESDGKHAWDYRKNNIFDFLNTKKYDVIGFQEPSLIMLNEIKHSLKDYDSFGAPRNEGGEFTPIFIKKGLFQIIESETFWLTDSPYVESKIEGSHYTRIATYVVLKLNPNRYLTIMNTHLDYANEKVIFNQIEYLYRMMKVLEVKYNTEMILMGDFNALPNSIGIEFLSSKFNQVYNDFKNIGLTFHAFSDLKDGQPIDYIFFSNQIKLENFEIIHHQEKGNYLSDHYPIFAQIKISN